MFLGCCTVLFGDALYGWEVYRVFGRRPVC